MIDLKTLREIGNAKGLRNVGQMEKDYFQEILLLFISRSSGSNLIFKGGTCLYKLYSLDRFSEDLDFDGYLGERFNSMLVHFLKNYGYSSRTKVENFFGRNESLKVLIAGPLYTGKNESMCRIVLDFSNREAPILQPSFVNFYPLYHDIPPFPIWSMNPSEILAEKIRALMYRKKARDLYDVYFLIKKGVKTTTDLLNKKLSIYGIEFSENLFQEGIETAKANWDSELSVFVNNLQAVGPISQLVAESLKKMQY